MKDEKQTPAGTPGRAVNWTEEVGASTRPGGALTVKADFTQEQQNLLNFEKNLPDKLKRKARWVLWGHEQYPGYSAKEPRWFKEPWQVPQVGANSHERASSTDSNTWDTFQAAMYALECSYKAQDGNYLGPGFVTGDGIIGGDIDNCVEYGDDDPDRLHPLIDWDVKKFFETNNNAANSAATYYELSPSGNGIRFVLDHPGKLKLPNGKAKYEGHSSLTTNEDGTPRTNEDGTPREPKDRHLEIYTEGQYIRMSGLTLTPTPLPVVTNEIMRIEYTNWIKKCRGEGDSVKSGISMEEARKKAQKLNLSGPVLEDKAVLRLAMGKAKNSREIKRLWEGELLPQNMGDESRGDMSLAQMLLFYCGNEQGRDVDQLIRLLEESPRMQRKGKRASEMAERVAVRAFKNLVEDKDPKVYSPRPKNNHKGQETAKQRDADPAREALLKELEDTTQEADSKILETYLSLDKIPCFEKSVFQDPDSKRFQHELLAHWILKHFKVVMISGILYVYDSGIYVTDTTNNKVFDRLIARMVNELKITERKEVLADLNNFCTQKADVSRDRHLIAFNNCLYDTNAKEILAFSPDYIITSKIPWDYDPCAYDERTDRFLDECTCGDSDMRKVLEEIIGYCFLRSNDFQKAFILTGQGSDGKSVFLGGLKNVLGPANFSTLDLKDLGERFRTAGLLNKLANIGDDIKANALSDSAVSTFKVITSGEEMTGEFKGRDIFTFTPYATPIFSANTVPSFGRTGIEAYTRRLLIIPFNNRVTLTDPYLKAKLCTKDAAMYLIRQGLLGLERLRENQRFTHSEAIAARVKAFEREANPGKAWLRSLEESLKNANPSRSVPDYLDGKTTTEVMSLFSDFCLENDLDYDSSYVKQLGKEIKALTGMTTKEKRITVGPGEYKKVRYYKKA